MKSAWEMFWFCIKVKRAKRGQWSRTWSFKVVELFLLWWHWKLWHITENKFKCGVWITKSGQNSWATYFQQRHFSLERLEVAVFWFVFFFFSKNTLDFQNSPIAINSCAEMDSWSVMVCSYPTSSPEALHHESLNRAALSLWMWVTCLWEAGS